MNPAVAAPLRRHRRGTLAAAALAGLLLAGCALLPPPPPQDYAAIAPADRTAHNLAVYDAAWRHVARGYYDDAYHEVDWQEQYRLHRPAAAAATTEEELYHAVNGLLDALEDNHTGALRPSAVQAEHAPQRVLIGIVLSTETVTAEPPGILVLDVMPGGAAAEAGVEPGWVLLSCDGHPPREVLGPGRLQAGQVVECVFRDNQDRMRTLGIAARPTATAPAERMRDLGDGLLYLRFDKFDGDSRHWLHDQLAAHRQARGIVLDLRENPGGDTAALGRMLREFFPRSIDMGTFISRRGFRFPLSASAWFSSGQCTAPLAVLVSEHSASSSEIFAAVVQHHRRGVIVGTKTAGAVLASRRFALPDGGRLQLSIDDYVDPGGRRLEGQGVTPDIPVEITVADRRARRDPALAAAVHWLLERAPAGT